MIAVGSTFSTSGLTEALLAERAALLLDRIVAGRTHLPPGDANALRRMRVLLEAAAEGRRSALGQPASRGFMPWIRGIDSWEAALGVFLRSNQGVQDAEVQSALERSIRALDAAASGEPVEHGPFSQRLAAHAATTVPRASAAPRSTT
jgi:hypothetical protein